MSDVKVVSYSWKSGSSEFKKYDVEVIATTLTEIRERLGGLTPRDVVQEAKDEANPLHPIIYSISDEDAAQLGREGIASRLIRSVRVKYMTPEKREIDTRAFVSMREKSGDRSYHVTSFAMEDEEGRALILRQAWLELKAWRRKYQELSELAAVFDAIDLVKEKVA